MTMLSGSPRRSPRRAPALRPGPLVALEGAHARFDLAGVRVTALAEGALWIETARTLVVSDLHLEKGAAFARRGQFLPPYDTRATIARLAALIDAHAPDCVVSLGDSFHDAHGPAGMAAEDAAALAAVVQRAPHFVWIEGNHDPHPPASLGGEVRAELAIEGLLLRHEPGPEAGVVAGHLHPCAKVAARGRAVRARCFATDGVRLVMPAFGAYTGGLNVCDAAFASVFGGTPTALILGRARIHPAAADRLIPDAFA